VSSLKTQRICPVVMRLKPDAALPSQADLSRDDLIDGLTQQLRTSSMQSQHTPLR